MHPPPTQPCPTMCPTPPLYPTLPYAYHAPHSHTPSPLCTHPLPPAHTPYPYRTPTICPTPPLDMHPGIHPTYCTNHVRWKTCHGLACPIIHATIHPLLPMQACWVGGACLAPCCASHATSKPTTSCLDALHYASPQAVPCMLHVAPLGGHFATHDYARDLQLSLRSQTAQQSCSQLIICEGNNRPDRVHCTLQPSLQPVL